MKKKWLVIVMAAVVFLLAACSGKGSSTSGEKSQSTWDKVKEAGVLKVATPGTLYPTSFYNDNKELTGFEIEMMNEIGKRLELEIEYVEIGVAEAFTSVDSGKVDVSMNNFDKTPERLAKYNISETYKYAVGGMIVREDDTSGITATDLSDWTGKKAGGGAGTQYMKIAEKLGAEPVIYDNVTNDVYVRDVATGRTDFIPNDYFTQRIALKFIAEQYPELKVKMGNVMYNPTEQGIIMSKDDDSLKTKIDDVIKAMKADGTLAKISEKYYDGQDLSKPVEGFEDLPVVDVSK